MIWTTKITVVDLHTGEELKKKHVTDGLYTIINKQFKNRKINEKVTEKNILWICEKNKQTKLF